MKLRKSFFNRTSVRRLRLRTVTFIALLWTFIDVIVVLLYHSLPSTNKINALILREIIVFISSVIMGYLLVVELRKLLRNFNLLTAFVLKSLVLIVAAILINLFIYAINSFSILGVTVAESFHHFYIDVSDTNKFLQRLLYWLVLFMITQLFIELNEKYSPGVFMDILLGRYRNPKIEQRIVMFIDLKDSTPIAEKLGSQLYFKFISEFIYYISNALIEYNGKIYQYVGDEIVVSWLQKKNNIEKSMLALRKARKNLTRQNNLFISRYGIVPEFRVGVHIGEVTVGEIGVIKKDIAMSGDVMNTAARIRGYCCELNKKVIVSVDFINKINKEEWQAQSLGMIELKGKAKHIELFSLDV
ncbi:MAG: adenylate/guanylate cyclase domain-containing protein [Parafilimonas sp.]